MAENKPLTGIRAKNRREILCAVLDEHQANLESALVIVAHCLQRQRELLDELKSLEGWTWKAEPASGIAASASIVGTHEVRLVPKEAAPAT